MPTPASHYYAPRPGQTRGEQPTVLPEPTVSYGELIVAALGLLVVGGALGMIVTAAILGALT